MDHSKHDNDIVPTGGEYSTQRVEYRGYPVDSFAKQDEILYSQVAHLIDESHG